MTEGVCNSSNINECPFSNDDIRDVNQDLLNNLLSDPPSYPTTPTTRITSTDNNGTPVRTYRESNQQLSYTPNGNAFKCCSR